MGSINHWHKSVLLACIAIVLFSGSVKAQPDDYSQNLQSIVNVFQATEDGFLKGIGLWDMNQEGFFVQIFDDSNFDLGSNAFGTYSASKFGGSSVPGEEYVELLFGSKISLTANETYAVRVQALMGPNHGVSFDSPADNTSYYLTGTTWNDLHDVYSGVTYTGGSTPAPANFVMDLLTTPLSNITATNVQGDNWTLQPSSFDEPNLLSLQAEATEMEPMVKLIDVEGDIEGDIADGGMGGQITLTEDVLNSITERDWIGFGFQLGYWDPQNQRFVASTGGDDLAFAITQSSADFASLSVLSEDHIQFGNGLVEPGDTASFTLLIDLPGGSDNFSFALRQYAVPEPSTFLLLAVSGMMMLLCGRRRR